MTDSSEDRRCPWCQGEITGHKNRIFCNQQCSNAWRYAKAVAENPKEYPTGNCPLCGVVVVHKKGRKYCCDAHRIADNNGRVTPEKRREYQQAQKDKKNKRAVQRRRILDGDTDEAKPFQPRRASLAEAQQDIKREIYG